MRILITETQLKKLIEQKSDFVMDRQYGTIIEQWWNDPNHPEYKQYAPTDYEKRELKKSETTLNNLSNLDPHTLATILQIGTAFIPVAGPFISAGIGLIDTALYYKEGDKTSAAVTGVFSVLPLIGPITSKIPGVKQLGSKGMAELWKKISLGGKNLSKVEMEVVNGIRTNENLIKAEANNASKKFITITEEIKKLKGPYIERFGQEKYETLVREFLSGATDKKQFLKMLSTSKPISTAVNFASKFGIKFTREELKDIHTITNIFNSLPKTLGKELLNTINSTVRVTTKTGRINVGVKFINAKQSLKLFGEGYDKVNGVATDKNIYLVVDNIKKLSATDVEATIYHEIAHMKDPAFASSKLVKVYKPMLDNPLTKSYYYHQFELVANTAKILNTLSTTTKRLMKTYGKERTLQTLDDIINWTKGVKKDMTDDMIKFLAYTDYSSAKHFKAFEQNPKERRNLFIKIAKQAEYLKSQVKMSF